MILIKGHELYFIWVHEETNASLELESEMGGQIIENYGKMKKKVRFLKEKASIPVNVSLVSLIIIKNINIFDVFFFLIFSCCIYP